LDILAHLDGGLDSFDSTLRYSKGRYGIDHFLGSSTHLQTLPSLSKNSLAPYFSCGSTTRHTSTIFVSVLGQGICAEAIASIT
jgi:hypothetical protein